MPFGVTGRIRTGDARVTTLSLRPLGDGHTKGHGEENRTWRHQRVSIPRPPVRQTGALPAELWRHEGMGRGGRGDTVRTCDNSLPKRGLYLTELHPDGVAGGCGWIRTTVPEGPGLQPGAINRSATHPGKGRKEKGCR